MAVQVNIQDPLWRLEESMLRPLFGEIKRWSEQGNEKEGVYTKLVVFRGDGR